MWVRPKISGTRRRLHQPFFVSQIRKTRWMDLLHSVGILAEVSFVLLQFSRLSDGQTGRQTFLSWLIPSCIVCIVWATYSTHSTVCISGVLCSARVCTVRWINRVLLPISICWCHFVGFYVANRAVALCYYCLALNVCRVLALFRNQSVWRPTGVENNQGQISHFVTPQNIFLAERLSSV